MSSYKFLLVPLFTVIVSQFIKFILDKENRFNIITFFDLSGGMPSSHSALVSSLTTMILLNYGAKSPIFAMALMFSLIILYDSKGVRYETGKQASIINQIAKEKKLKLNINLKEKIGHKPIEVLFGTILGIISGLIFYKII